ncbi:ABC transporter permease [Enterovirga rhinocerotis]|uniref:Spermidine/putrescine transport system permease protein n=1 Tax=Enterovirga rhinocerotis TaxID=1339210 RepID=A0A4V3DXV6_9HYPH|nr:ABC transporter permease [Enterovirga rhinocerotis]TDR90239.1 spermidine/putrescine transport system permease protein [Enterovirga rhinocerotis]
MAGSTDTAGAPADRLGRLRATALSVYAGLFYAVLYLPILLLVVLSFNDSQSIGLPFKGVTLRWFEEVLGSSAMRTSIANSVLLGIASSVIATVLALMLALGFRNDFAFKNLLMKVVLLPILVPGIVGGVIYLVFFGYAELPFGVWSTALPVHITWVLPFAFLTLFPRVHGLDRSLEEAAADLGARPWVTFRRVTFPLIKPGVVATTMFAFTLSFDEFIRTLFSIGNERTVPVHLWSLLSDQMAPFLPAVGVVIMAISMMVSLAGFALSARADRRPR